MKLARIAKALRSVQVRVMLAGDLNARFEHYAQYMSTFMVTPWTRGRSSQRSFAPFSTPTVSSTRGRALAVTPNRAAALVRYRPTAS
jgi:hypothetical protein